MPRRRTRIALGFGQQGRAGLLGSLLPTAQDQADAQRVLQVQDNEKISAFNNDMITFAQLEAYFTDRLARSSSDIDRAQVNSMLTSARAANKKKATAASMNAAVFALTDFQEGSGSYEEARTAIEKAVDEVDEPENIEKLEQMLRGARSIKTARAVTAKVNEYNNGGKFSEAHKYLTDALATETNEQLKTQINQSLITLRKAENNRVITQATAAYNANGDVNAALAVLQGLRADPTQTDAEEVTKISAQMEGLATAEQMSIDSKKYIAWQTHQISDEAALSYFQGRLATARNPKDVEYLGKYAANIQQTMDNALKAAQGRAASVARTASTAANAAVSRQDNLSEMEWKYFEDKMYPDMLKEAGIDRTGKTSGPINIEIAAKAADYRKNVLDGLIKQGGYYAANYAFLKATADREFRTDVSNALHTFYKDVQAENLKELKGGKLGDLTEFTDRSLKVMQAAADVMAGPYEKYFSDPQKTQAQNLRNDVASTVQKRLDAEAVVRRKAEGTIENQVSELYNMMNDADRAKLAQAIGIKADPNALRDIGAGVGLPGDQQQKALEAGGKLTLPAFSKWLLENPAQRLPIAMNLGIDPDKAKGLLPGALAEFSEKFMGLIDASKRGKILGGDSEFKRNYVAFLMTTNPNSFRTIMSNGLLYRLEYDASTGTFTGGEMLDDMTPENMRRMQLIERMADQPFRGAEIPASGSNPDPAKSIIFDEVGEPSMPQWNPVSPEQMRLASTLPGPLGAAAVVAFAFGDNWDNIQKWTKENGKWWVENMDDIAAGVANAAPGSSQAIAGAKYFKELWDDVMPEGQFDSFWQNVVQVRDTVGETVGGFFGEIGKRSEPGQEAFRQQEEARRTSEHKAAIDLSPEFDQFGEWAGEQAGNFVDLSKQRFEQWQELGAGSWAGIQANVEQTWPQTLATVLGTVLPGVPNLEIPTLPTWNGWDALTTQAQATVQELINGINLPDFQLPGFNTPEPPDPYNPSTPGYTPPGYSVAPIEGSPEESFDQYIPPDYYNVPDGWAAGSFGNAQLTEF